MTSPPSVDNFSAPQHAARHLRWLARRVSEREAECAAELCAAPPMRYCDVLYALVLFKNNARALANHWQAWAADSLGPRMQAPEPCSHTRRRHQHGTRIVMADLAHDRTLLIWHQLCLNAHEPADRRRIRQLAEWVAMQPDGALRITPECVPRLLTLAACAEAAAGLPEQPAQWQGKPQGPLLNLAHVLGEHVHYRADALLHALRNDAASGFTINLRLGQVTPEHDPKRWRYWVGEAQAIAQRHPAARHAGWRQCTATLHTLSDSRAALHITLETHLDARHLEWHTELSMG